VVLAALLAGVAVGLLVARLLTGVGGPAPQPSVERLDLPSAAPAAADAAPAPGPPARTDLLAVRDATSPEAAVRGFLTAEALQDFAASYAFLGPDDLAVYPSEGAWVAAHADLPPVTGFAVEQVEGGRVTTLTAQRSTLDPVLGLVPARSRATWETVEVDGGFRVAFGRSTAVPLYPGEEGVGAAARAWASARQGCGSEGQVDGALLGTPVLAEQLCGRPGELVVGQAGPLPDGAASTPLLDAFGPEVFTWARVVPVREPVALQAVLAPVDDRWLVIGVLAGS
jgi:hypothetical protein